MLMGVTAVFVTSWVVIKAEVSGHGAQLQVISTTVTDDHDQLKIQGAILQQQASLLATMNQKLDRLTYQRERAGGYTGGGN